MTVQIKVGQVWQFRKGQTYLITKIDSGMAYSIMCLNGKEHPECRWTNVDPVTGITPDDIEDSFELIFDPDHVKIEVGQIWSSKLTGNTYRIVKVSGNKAHRVQIIDGKDLAEELFIFVDSNGYCTDGAAFNKHWELQSIVGSTKLEVGQVWKDKYNDTCRISRVSNSMAYCYETFHGKEHEVEREFCVVNEQGYSRTIKQNFDLIDYKKEVTPGIAPIADGVPPANVKVEIGQVWKDNDSDTTYHISKIESNVAFCVKDGRFGKKDIGFAQIDSNWFLVHNMIPNVKLIRESKPQIKVGQVWVNKDGDVKYTITSIKDGMSYGSRTRADGKEEHNNSVFSVDRSGKSVYIMRGWELMNSPDDKEKSKEPTELAAGQVWKHKTENCTYTINRFDDSIGYWRGDRKTNGNTKDKDYSFFRNIEGAKTNWELIEMSKPEEVKTNVVPEVKFEVGQIWKNKLENKFWKITRIENPVGGIYCKQFTVLGTPSEAEYILAYDPINYELFDDAKLEVEKPKETFKIAVGDVWSNLDGTKVWRISNIHDGEARGFRIKDGKDEFTNESRFTDVDSNCVGTKSDFKNGWKKVDNSKPAWDVKIQVGDLLFEPGKDLVRQVTSIANGCTVKNVGSNSASYYFGNLTPEGYPSNWNSTWRVKSMPAVTTAPAPVAPIKKGRSKIEVGQIWKDKKNTDASYTIIAVKNGQGYYKNKNGEDYAFCDVSSDGFSREGFEESWELVGGTLQSETKVEEKNLMKERIKLKPGQIMTGIASWNRGDCFRFTAIKNNGREMHGFRVVAGKNTGSENYVAAIDASTGFANSDTFEKNWAITEPVVETKPDNVDADNNNFKLEVGQFWTLKNGKSRWRVTRVDGKTVYGVTVNNGKEGSESQFVSIHPDGTANDDAFRESWKLVPPVKEEASKIKTAVVGTKIEVGQLWKCKSFPTNAYRITRVDKVGSYGTLIADGKEQSGERVVFVLTESGHTSVNYLDWQSSAEDDIVSKVDEVKPVKIVGVKGTKFEPGQLWKSKYATYKLTRFEGGFCYGKLVKDGQELSEIAVFLADKNGCATEDYSPWELDDSSVVKKDIVPKILGVKGTKLEIGQLWKAKQGSRSYRITRVDDSFCYGIHSDDSKESAVFFAKNGCINGDYSNWELVEPGITEKTITEPTKIEVGQVLTYRDDKNNVWRITKIDSVTGDIYGIRMDNGKDVGIERLFNTGPANMELLKKQCDITVPELKLEVQDKISKPELKVETKPAETAPVKNNNYKIELGQVWICESDKRLITRIDNGQVYATALNNNYEKVGRENYFLSIRADGITEDSGLRSWWNLKEEAKPAVDKKDVPTKIEVGQIFKYRHSAPGTSWTHRITKIANNCAYGVETHNGIDKVIETCFTTDVNVPISQLSDWDVTPSTMASKEATIKSKTKVEVGQVWKGKNSGDVVRVTKIFGGIAYCIQIIDRKEAGVEHTFASVDSEGYADIENLFNRVDPKTVMPTMEKIKIEVGQVLQEVNTRETWTITSVDLANKTCFAKRNEQAAQSFGPITPEGYADYWGKYWLLVNAPVKTTTTKLVAGQVWEGKPNTFHSGKVYRITKVNDTTTFYREVIGGKDYVTEQSFNGTSSDCCSDWELVGASEKAEEVKVAGKKAATQLKVGQTWKGKANTWAAGITYNIVKVKDGLSYATRNNGTDELVFYATDKDGCIADEADLDSWELIETPAKPTRIKIEIGQVWTRKSDKEVYTIVDVTVGQSYADHGSAKRIVFTAVDSSGFAVSKDILDRWDVATAVDPTKPVMSRYGSTKEWKLKGSLHREDGPAQEFNDGTTIWFLNGVRHRIGGPAYEHSNGAKSWWVNGKRHREDGPAIENADGTKVWYLNGEKLTEEEFGKKMNVDLVKPISILTTLLDGTQEWRVNGKLHREDGPARITPDGEKVWYKNGVEHRDDGPALEHANGSKAWIVNGVYHRENGPAVERFDGTKNWYLDGNHLSEKEFIKRMNLTPKKETVNSDSSLWLAGSAFTLGAVASTVANVAHIIKDGRFVNQKMEVGQVWTNDKNGDSYRISSVRPRGPYSNEWAAFGVQIQSNGLEAKDASERSFISVNSSGITNELIDNWKLETIKPKENEIVATKHIMKVGQIYSDGVDTYRISSLSKRPGTYNAKESWVAKGIKTKSVFGTITGKETDFVYMNEACEADRLNTIDWKLEQDALNAPTTFVDQVKGDLEAAGYRVASTQFTAAIKGAILLLFKDKGYDESKLSVVKEVLESEFGTAIVSTVLGYGLTYMPSLKDDPRVVKLAGEFRISGMATVGNEVFGMGMQYVMPALTTALKALPAVEIKKVVKKPAKKKRVVVAPVVIDQGQNVTEDKLATIH